ncbi:MAG TPA: hypothetical protein VM712_16800, partial [Gaiellales bacterium]|nr:hypothetical protein [Gaiellales bacterium]
LLRAGNAPDSVIRAMLWANAERVAMGRPAETLSPPLLAGDVRLPLQRLRIHEYLAMGTTLLWLNSPDTPGVFGLARCACDTSGSDELSDVAELIDAVRDCWADDRRMAFRLNQIALLRLLVR